MWSNEYGWGWNYGSYDGWNDGWNYGWNDGWNYGSYGRNYLRRPRNKQSTVKKEQQKQPQPKDEPMSIATRLSNTHWTGWANDVLAAAESEQQALSANMQTEGLLTSADDRWIGFMLSLAAKDAIVDFLASLSSTRPIMGEAELWLSPQRQRFEEGNQRQLKKKCHVFAVKTALQKLQNDTSSAAFAAFYNILDMPEARFPRRVIRDAYIFRVAKKVGFSDRSRLISEANKDFAPMSIDMRAQLLLAYASLMRVIPRVDSFLSISSAVARRRGRKKIRKKECDFYLPKDVIGFADELRRRHPNTPLLVFPRGATYSIADLQQAGFDIVGDSRSGCPECPDC